MCVNAVCFFYETDFVLNACNHILFYIYFKKYIYTCIFISVKNQHLWEFIYEVLMNPMYNPQYVRWENQREGVFRFVQSEAVAQLWGSLKNNDNMTYEKLSRAMR